MTNLSVPPICPFLPAVRQGRCACNGRGRGVESTHEKEKYCKRNLRTGHRAAIHRGTGHRAAVQISAWRYLGATANSSSLHSQIPVVLCASSSISAGGGQRPKRLGLPTDAVRFWHLSASSSRAQIPQPPGRSPPGGLSRQSVKPQPGLRLSSSVADAPLVGGAHVDLRSTTKIHRDSK